jgi:hypothetical protein
MNRNENSLDTCHNDLLQHDAFLVVFVLSQQTTNTTQFQVGISWGPPFISVASLLCNERLIATHGKNAP